ncbi:hypothetical protein TNCT_576651 [Trichonephila clavata]|uniref:Uncharacterized protein n=1 Tax=Trichonephila clavata TaxID=2740835 RepID=A0A8X6F9C7_TRICU|nr:hypothetical protein TNCT_576651 [Trichonephila clavata]
MSSLIAVDSSRLSQSNHYYETLCVNGERSYMMRCSHVQKMSLAHQKHSIGPNACQLFQRSSIRSSFYTSETVSQTLVKWNHSAAELAYNALYGTMKTFLTGQ